MSPTSAWPQFIRTRDFFREVSRIVGVGSDQKYMSAWIGIETGSCRILKMHMPQ